MDSIESHDDEDRRLQVLEFLRPGEEVIEHRHQQKMPNRGTVALVKDADGKAGQRVLSSGKQQGDNVAAWRTDVSPLSRMPSQG